MSEASNQPGRMNETLGEKSGLPIMAFPSRDAWAAWLDEHHTDSTGTWLALLKKGAGEAGISYSDAVEVALCYGWIDGQAGKLDDRFWLQRFTPRRAKSIWSRVNRDRALALMARGEMQPAGLREVERAQADGRWQAAYEPPSTMEVPDDLRQALAANPAAAEAFAALNRTNRYSILHRIHAAKKPETRTRRIETFVAMLAEGNTPLHDTRDTSLQSGVAERGAGDGSSSD
jgi:uncharacterized protein YdeI (YjbR/CyaY-like superfamily)